MTFSSYLKEELEKKTDLPRHCLLAELGGMLMSASSIRDGDLLISSENRGVIEKAAFLIKKLFGIECEITQRKNSRSRTIGMIEIKDPEEAGKILSGVKAKAEDARILPSPLVFRMGCCKRSFLRGAYLCLGTISDPVVSYHIEFTCRSAAQAELVMKAAEGMGTPLRYITRRKYHIVYEKEAEAISALLVNMGARVSLLELENRRIIRETRGNVNRLNNCETANIDKAAAASARVLKDIEYIIEAKGLDYLEPRLRETAHARMEDPEIPLKDLGEKLDPPVGKSGVNHRLRKISEIAEALRDENSSADILTKEE